MARPADTPAPQPDVAPAAPQPQPIANYVGPTDAPVTGVPMRDLFADDYPPEDVAAIVADWPRHYRLAETAPTEARAALARIKRERQKAAEAPAAETPSAG